MLKAKLEKALSKKFSEIQEKIKGSFALIRQDIKEMESKVEAMRTYLKKQDKLIKYARREDNKLRDEFRRDVDEFTQKISQLKLALSTFKAIQKDVVVIKDLARIEDRIKISFKQEIESYKSQTETLKESLKAAEKRISSLEKGHVREKRGWFFKKP